MVNNERGVFAIEMSFVLFFIAALLMFTADIAFKLFSRVALDRVSYSLVNIVKERSRFYDKRIILNQQDIDDVANLASRILTEKHPFGLSVQSLYQGVHQTFDTDTGCNVPALSAELVPENIAGTGFPLYQVTLCYEIDNWFDRFSGRTTKSRLQSTSVIVGR